MKRPVPDRSVAVCLVAVVAVAGLPSCARADVRGREQQDASATATLTRARVPAASDPCRGTPLPPDQHYVANGLCARLVATHQGALREISFVPNGDLIGVTQDGVIRRFRDANRNGQFDADEIVDWATTGGSNGHNCHWDAGYLYCGSPNGVKRWKYEPRSTSGGAGEDVLVGQPGGGNHPFHPVHVYDRWMYVDSGSERNMLQPMPDRAIDERAVLRRFDLKRFAPNAPLSWRDGEIVVRGARNITGFARDSNGRLYGVINGIDDLRYEERDVHTDNPGEAFALLEVGQDYGWPSCFVAQRIVEDGGVVAPGTQLHAEAMSDTVPNVLLKSTKDDAWCAAHAARPMSFFEAHSAPLDVVLFDAPSASLPSRWRGGAFVTLHGSWDREPSTGYKVVWIPRDASGKAPMPESTTTNTTFPYEVVFGGGRQGAPKDGEWGWSAGGAGEAMVRPVGIAISPVDGALYVSSDDKAVQDRPGRSGNAKGDGAVYRISLSAPKTPGG